MATSLRTFLTPPPGAQTLAQLEQYTHEELQKLFVMVDLLVQGHHEISYVEPAKKEDGLVVYADGLKWNPGNGAGFYYWNGSIWVQLQIAAVMNTVATDSTQSLLELLVYAFQRIILLENVVDSQPLVECIPVPEAFQLIESELDYEP